MNFVIYILILILLIFASYKDYRQRIIPDSAVFLVFIFSSLSYFLSSTNIIDYFFYIFLASVPMLMIGYIADAFEAKKLNKIDLVIILASIVVGVLLPFSIKLKFVAACAVLITAILIEQFLFSKSVNSSDEEDASTVGGGDIKLIAALGPVLQEEIFFFIFVAFLLAYMFMKIKKYKNIYMAPFMCTAYCLVIALKIFIK